MQHLRGPLSRFQSRNTSEPVPLSRRDHHGVAGLARTQTMRSNSGTAIVALMCLSLVTPPEAAVSQEASQPSPLPQTRRSPRPEYRSTQIQGDERVLHALNRFTFGPRPGDLEAVKAMGLERWFDQQLHPAAIDQSDLNARLAEYPAMQWSSEELLYRLPSGAVIRQAMDGKAPIPDRGVLHAVYEDQIYRVAERKQEKQNKQVASAAAASNGIMTTPAPAMDANTATPQYKDLANLQDMLDKDDDKKPAGIAKSSKSAEPVTAANGMESAQPAPNMTAAAAQSMASTATPAQPPADQALITKVVALPAAQRIAKLTSMQPPDADAFFKSLKGPQRVALMAGLAPEQKETVRALENPQRTVVEELVAQRLTRDIYSSTQLQEVMTDFWLNHFNVYLQKNEATPYYLVSYERDVIRPHALGKFEDLLEATAHSPAMMLYLDNAESIGPDSRAAVRVQMAAARQPANQRKAPQGLNENYARELMELHTLGVNGGYTQADVIQVARILTGWTVDRPQRGGGFMFNPNRHEPGTKKVMGKKFKESGEREGRDLLHFLVTRPATAHFISRKLAMRFVSDDPPQSLVDRMAKSYLSSGGDIAAVLKTMFRSQEFWSNGVYRAKVKTPLEYVVSAARASNADITNLQPLANALREMGMPLYGAIPPTGYKWDAADWVSTGALVNRMNFALSLAANRLPGIAASWSGQPVANPAAPPSLETEEARLEPLLVAGGVSASTRAAVLQQFEEQSAQASQPQPGMPPQLQAHAPTAPAAAGAAPQPPVRPQAVPVAASGPQKNRPTAVSAQEKQDQLLAGLLLGSPEFQRR